MDDRYLIAALIKLLLKKNLGDDYTIEFRKLVNNNSQVKEGLDIFKKDSSFVQTMDISDLIYSILDGTADMGEAVDDIIKTYHNSLTECFDATVFNDFDNVKDKIIFQIVNTEQNRELLRHVPSIPFLNLSLIFKVMLDPLCEGNPADVLITNQHLFLWNVTPDTIYNLARKNTPRLLPAKIVKVADLIWQGIEEKGVQLPASCGSVNEMLPLYCLSNSELMHGCSCMNYNVILSDFAKSLDSDLYILPSSIHEVLLLPVSLTYETPLDLHEMVLSSNLTNIRKDEFLSDNIYFFNRASGEVKILI